MKQTEGLWWSLMAEDHTRAVSFRVSEDVYKRVLAWRERAPTESDVNISTSLRRLLEQGLKEKERKAGK
jgi:hypothetical protein